MRGTEFYRFFHFEKKKIRFILRNITRFLISLSNFREYQQISIPLRNVLLKTSASRGVIDSIYDFLSEFIFHNIRVCALCIKRVKNINNFLSFRLQTICTENIAESTRQQAVQLRIREQRKPQVRRKNL